MSFKLSKLIFLTIAALWILMVYYTLIPWIMHVSLPIKHTVDLSGVTWILVALSMSSSVLWLGMQLGYLFTRKKLNVYTASLIRSKRYTSGEPLVSIIIPARNEESVIKRTIVSCLAQSYKNIEVLVVCHNCSDGTYSAAQSPDHRVWAFDYKTEEAGKGIALNFGLSKSSGEYVLVVDSDGILANDFIANALPLFDENIAAIQGKIIGSNTEYNRITKLLSLEGYLFSTPFMTVRSILDRRVPLGGTGCMIRRDKLDALGGFRNALIDDFELSFRMFRNKLRIAFAPLSVVYDEKPPDFDLMVRQRSRWVKGHIDLLKERVPEWRDVLGMIYWLNPIFMLAGLAAISISCIAVVSYILFGEIPYTFSFAPIWLWIGMSTASFALQMAVLIADFGPKGLKYAGYVGLLSAFSHYWYVSLLRSFFVKSWGATKTTHGFISQADIEQIIREQDAGRERDGADLT